MLTRHHPGQQQRRHAPSPPPRRVAPSEVRSVESFSGSMGNMPPDVYTELRSDGALDASRKTRPFRPALHSRWGGSIGSRWSLVGASHLSTVARSVTVKRRVLVVDDDLDTSDQLSTLLDRDGYTCERASNGLDALGDFRCIPRLRVTRRRGAFGGRKRAAHNGAQGPPRSLSPVSCRSAAS